MKGLKIGMLALVLCGAFQAQGQSAGRVQIQADPRIEELLRLRVENNDDGRKVDGFVIQIYYGRKQQATRVLEAFREAYPMEYDTPDYKVFVGAYLTQQQAQQALAVLKQNPDYSGAFVRAKKITVYDW